MNSMGIGAEVHGNYVGNQWQAASSKATFDDENPARKGCVLASFQASSPRDVTHAVDAAANFRGGAAAAG